MMEKKLELVHDIDDLEDDVVSERTEEQGEERVYFVINASATILRRRVWLLWHKITPSVSVDQEQRTTAATTTLADAHLMTEHANVSFFCH